MSSQDGMSYRYFEWGSELEYMRVAFLHIKIKKGTEAIIDGWARVEQNNHE
ncbi:hypothetical protein AG1IA_05534 [Rhizoctonia solani AG-1 IA]|uniref:Uncharacterized protein n=1 Tax=Thanatephorus cucumeris (strain AG1-IA) TaxID=983506 RepID=L8WQZ9_THACA|nr:hypothetical protein AG1IA_05534 [Rhizoctonia solani AG-1 IA]